MKTKSLPFIFLFCFLLSSTQAFAQKTTIEVLTYYGFAPFIIDESKEQGLVYDFTRYLNTLDHPQYHFKALYLPRKRLNARLAQKQRVIIAFVSPKWFKGADNIWSIPVLVGQNDVISLKDKPVEFTGVSSLLGKTLVASLGSKFPVIEQALANGDIKRVNGLTMPHVAKLLIKNRGDFSSMPKISSLYVFKELQALDKIHYSAQPLFTFKRHLLLSPILNKLKPWIDDLISHSVTDPAWLATIHKYGLNSILIGSTSEKTR